MLAVPIASFSLVQSFGTLGFAQHQPHHHHKLFATSTDASDEGPPSRKKPTLCEEWEGQQTHFFKLLNSIQQSGLKDLEQQEAELRLQLRESIEEMRENLLEETHSHAYTVRSKVNQDFMETRQQIKNDLRKLRDSEAEKLETNRASITAELENMDQELKPVLLTHNGNETWSEMVVRIKQVPSMATLLNAMDQAGSATDKFIYEETPAAKGIKASMDRFRFDMEDQLEDLRGNTRFQIQISEDKTRWSENLEANYDHMR